MVKCVRQVSPRAILWGGFVLVTLLFVRAGQATPAPETCPSGDTSCGWTRLLTDKAFGKSPTVRDMAVDPAGNVYLAGETYPETAQFGQSDTLIVKYDARGNRLWTQRLAASGGGFNMAYGIDVDAAGGICVGGTTDGLFGKGKAKRGGGFVARYNAQGKRLWAQNTADPVMWVDVNSAGHCHAASLGQVIKFDTSGKPMWRYQGEIGAMTASSDGRVYIANQPGRAALRLTVVGEDGREQRSMGPALGNTLGWSQIDLRNLALADDGQGGLYLQATLTGKDRTGAVHIGAFLARIDLVGKLQWERYYGPEQYRWDSFDIAVDASSNAYLAGRRMTIPKVSPTDVFAVSFGSDGTLRWARAYGTPVFDGAGRIAVDRSGSYYIAGGTEGDLDGQINPVERIAVPFIARNRP